MTYPGRPLLKPAQDRGRADRALLDLLKEPEDRVRYRAKIELSGRDTKDVLAALQTWMDRLDPKDPRLRAPHDGSALGAAVAQPGDETLLKRMLRSKEPLGARRRDARAVLLAGPRRRIRWRC